MWIKIQCPACQTESSSSLPTASYKGHYRCWKCRALFAVEVEDGELISYQPITEDELEDIKAKQEAEKKGLPYTPKAAPAAPVVRPQASQVAPKIPEAPCLPKDTPVAPTSPSPATNEGADSATPDFFKELGKPKPGVVQGIEYSKPHAAPEPAVIPPQAASVTPIIPEAPCLRNDTPGALPSPSPATNEGTDSATPDFFKELGKPKPGVAQGIEYSKPQAAPEPAVIPPQAASVTPIIPEAPCLPKEKAGVVPSGPNLATGTDTPCARPPAPKPPEPKVEVSGSGGKTVKIDAFNFGFIVVNGKQYNYDVAILPDGRVNEREPGRGRIGSHSITGSQLDPILRTGPEVILVGTGMRGMARLSEQRASNVDIRVMSSPAAVEEFNKLTTEGKRVAALIHITC